MRKLVLLGLLALPLAFACKPSGGAADAGPSASATAPATSAAASAPGDDGPAEAAPSAPTATGAPAAAMPPTTPMIGQPCHPGVDTVGCGPGHENELTCSGGAWRVLQTCRGAGHCQGVGAATTCSVGALMPGDACVAANSPGRCLRPKAFAGCENGRWSEVVCPGPTVCRPNGAGPGQPACR